MTLLERMAQLEKIQEQMPQVLDELAEAATLRAVEKASELTPPVGEDGDLSGTHTRTGELKQHWATDSVTTPRRSGSERETVLANDKEYASYVNDGHDMDRHFVPGLYINPYSGHLEYDPSADVGLIVGTRTSYVKGLFMVDAAKKEYEKALKEQLKKLEGLFK